MVIVDLRGLGALSLAFALSACPNGHGQADSGEASTTTGGETTATTDGGTDSSTDGETGTSTGGVDCSQFTDPNDCEAAGCCAEDVGVETAVDLTTCTFEHPACAPCLTLGDPDTEAQTYYRDPVEGGQVQIFTTLTDCGVDYNGDREQGPVGDAWHRCDGSESDPPECGCYCVSGECRWDVGRAALDACGFDELCVAVPDGDIDTCFHQALVDGVTGFIDIDITGDDLYASGRIYLVGDGTAGLSVDIGCINGPCCSPNVYRFARCDVDADAFATSCLDEFAADWGCFLESGYTQWISNCTVIDPVCP